VRPSPDLYADDRHFRGHIVMARHGFGRCIPGWFQSFDLRITTITAGCLGMQVIAIRGLDKWQVDLHDDGDGIRDARQGEGGHCADLATNESGGSLVES
jgi:hypothetical protein